MILPSPQFLSSRKNQKMQKDTTNSKSRSQALRGESVEAFVGEQKCRGTIRWSSRLRVPGASTHTHFHQTGYSLKKKNAQKPEGTKIFFGDRKTRYPKIAVAIRMVA